MTYYLILKSLHIMSMVTWFAGLFYLPRLFVYHSQITKDGQTTDEKGHHRFCIMERKLTIMMHVGMSLTWFFGLWLMLKFYSGAGWLHVKLVFVIGLVFFQFLCTRVVKNFRNMENSRSEKYYRWFNEAPVVTLVAAVLLAVLKPF